MKRSALILALAGILLLSAPAFAVGEKETVPCAVCGYLIDKDTALTAQYEGVAYYFCEAGCKAYFMKDPAAVAAGMDLDPVCGMTVKKAGSIEAVHNGRQIHFCSNDCKDKYFASPAEYEINFDVVSSEVKPQKDMKHTLTFEGRPYCFASAENKATFEKNPDAYVYAECPVSGKVFLRKDAGGTAVYEGKTYYFCCKDCLAKFNKEPKKYGGALKAGAEGCAHEKRTKEMKKTAGAAAEAGCPVKKAGGCPMEKECKK